ncbi:S1 family peptidase [Streptomyces virginiae]|uniref:S1 family peptidase n=1 Tax=Streptomyces virginiae TaxID=1961 RepID=UPI0036C30D88
MAIFSAVIGLIISGSVSFFAESSATAGNFSKIESTGKLLPAGFSSWGDLMRVQARLDVEADKVSNAPDARRGGYSSIVVSAEKNRLRIYWKGVVPLSVRSVIDRIPSDIAVEVLQAPYSLQDLKAAMAEIAEGSSSIGARISQISPKLDGTGLKAVVVGDLQSAQSIPSIKQSPVPVSLEAGVHLAPTIGDVTTISRKTDSSPFKGGSLYYAPGKCSTGFAVRIAPGGPTGMMTAAHCTWVSDVVRVGGPTAPPVGEVIKRENSRDVAVIDMPSAARVYRGGVNSMQSTKVTAALGTYVGDWVCTGGARTGEHCMIVIDAVEVNDLGSTPKLYGLASGVQWQGGIAVALGDSGGPVFSPSEDNTALAAKGIIARAGIPVPCIEPGVNECYNRVAFQPIGNALGALGVALRTD